MAKVVEPGSQNKGKMVLFLIAVFLTNIAVMGDNILYPITTNIYDTFPQSTATVNYILSGPPLLLVVASLVAPFLLNKMSKRSLLIIGMSLFVFGAVFGVVFENVIWMAVTRSLVGVGQGFVNVAAIGLITDAYLDETERSRYVGFFNASMNVIGASFMYLSGVLAAGAWQNVFLIYISAVPALVLVILFVPNFKSIGSAPESGKTISESERKGLGFEFWEMIITFFVAAMLCMCLAYFLSVYIAETGIGDPNSLAANAGTVGQIASLICGLVFGLIFVKLRRLTLLLGYILTAVTMLLWMNVSSAPMVYVLQVAQALAYFLAFSYCYAQCPSLVAPEKVNLAIGIVTASYGLASFAATYFVTGVMGVMGASSVAQVIPVFVAIACAVVAVDAVAAFATRNKAKAVQQERDKQDIAA